MAEKISIGIALEGGAEVKRQLADIGDTGEKAFDQISKATQDVGLEKLGEAGNTAAEGISKTGEAADKASESMSKLSLETVKTSAEIAKNAAEIAKIGVEIGLLVTRHESLVVSLIKTVVHVRSAVTALELMVATLNPVTIAIGATVVALGGLALALEAVGKAAATVAGPYEKLNHTLETLSTTTGQSSNSLQQGQAAFGQLGISAERFGEIITKISETMASFDVGSKIQESADKVLESEKALLEAQLKLEALGGPRASVDAYQRLLDINRQLEAATSDRAKAEAAASTAAEANAKAVANNLKTIIPLVKQIEEGQKGLTFDSLTTAETKINAVTASMKQAAGSGKIAGQVLVEFIANADKLSAIQVGKAFGINAEDVDRIQRLGGHLNTVDEIWKRIQSAGVLIPPETAAALERMRTEIQAVEQAQVRLQQAWDSSIFARFGASVSASLNSLKADFINFAAGALEAVNSFFNALPPAVDQSMAQVKSIWFAAWSAMAAAASQAFSAIGFTGIGEKLSALSAQWKQSSDESARAAEAAGQRVAAAWGLAANQSAQQIQEKTAAVATGFQSWDTVVQQSTQGFKVWAETGAQAGAQVGEGIKAAAPAVDELTNKVTALQMEIAKLSNIPPPDPGPAVSAWNRITAAIQGAIDRLLQFLGLQSRTPAPAAGGGAPAAARGGLLGGRGSGTSDSNLAWVSRGEYIMPAAAVRQPGVLAFLEALRRSGGIPGFAAGGSVGGGDKSNPLFGVIVRIIEQLSQSMNGVIEQLRQIANANQTFTTNMGTEFDNFGNQMVNGLRGLWEKIRDNADKVTNDLQKVGQSLGDIVMSITKTAGGKAGGGLLGGRGTGTSDSNLAWVSRGEHIMPARAVAQPGVLAFLEALRRSGGNLSAVLDGMGRFALGGMIRGPMPAFAAGGLAGGMSNVTIQFPGLPAIGGLRASSAVVDELHRAAALAQVRSGGRKPSRYS